MSDVLSFIPLASPDIREADIQNVVDVLNSGMLIQGQKVMQLEHQFATFANVSHAIAVCNGTATMHMVLKALGIGEGDEVIVPAFSYVATANVVELVGATPIFVDIELATFNINSTLIEQKITSKTKAIIPVHEFGLACNIIEICELAKKHNIYVIEDAACALGAHQNNQKVGSFGIAGSFSLHPRKSITSGEGGIITSNDQALSVKLRQLRNHGIEMVEGKMVFEEAGFNYRLTDIQAALASSQFERIEDTLAYKNELAAVYFTEIKNDKITLPFVPSDRNHSWQTFHILLDESMDQARVIDKLKQNNIGSNYGAQCIPAQKYYKSKYNLNYKQDYRNAYTAYNQGIALPLYEKLTKSQIQYISKIINSL
jgi:dTDP-4-amino-4,6-dideoxygalactose transaminase